MKRTQMQKRPKGPTPQPGTAFPPITPAVLTPALLRMMAQGHIQMDTRAFRMGDLVVMVSHDPVNGWHMSVSHESRQPTWDEVAHLRYALLPDQVTMAYLLPPKDDYINLHPNCMQIVEVRRADF